ncbi:MAG: peptide deformylase [Clostridia bacterium]|nr:peptide deformylase [Clostridia bacterium]
MALRKIRIIEDDLLRNHSREIKEIDNRICTLLDDMAETMYASDGVGLAAPQVGVLRRAVVIDVGEGLVELINPVITNTAGEQTGAEACLSVPGLQGTVTRPMQVTVSAKDREGKPFTMTVEGFFARAVCHEVDHLDGILFTDKAIDIEQRGSEE